MTMLKLGWLKQGLEDLTGRPWLPLRLLVLSLTSVWLAWQWLRGGPKVPIAIAVVVILIAYLSDFVGRKSLPESPQFGLFFMELWIAAPLMLGAIAAAGLVVLSVEHLVQENAAVERKQLIGAASAAISGFLTSALISWAGDKDDSRVAKRIERIFQTKYQRLVSGATQEADVKYLVAGSDEERLVYSNDFAGASGWGHKARHVRARELEKLLNPPTA